MTAPQASSRALESVLDNLDREEPAALNRLFRLLAIPSISTDPAFHEACIEAAEACAGARAPWASTRKRLPFRPLRVRSKLNGARSR